MRVPVPTKIKPANGFSHLLYIGLQALFPIVVFVLIRVNIAPLAFAVILLSKWRMFVVRPRHWPANIRANAVDLMVGASAVVFMLHSDTQLIQLIWVLAYGGWLIGIKPNSTMFAVSVQAMIGQLCALMALYIGWGDAPLGVLVAATGTICYLCARHFLSSFDEPLTRLLAYIWAFFGASLAWVLGHWLLFYGVVSQPTLLLTVIGYGIAAMYYLDHNDKLSLLVKRQFIFIMLAIIMIVLVFSNWGDKTV